MEEHLELVEVMVKVRMYLAANHAWKPLKVYIIMYLPANHTPPDVYCYLFFLHSVSVSTENSPTREGQDASISLPPSLFAELELVNTTKVGMGFTFYENATLFPLPEGSPSDLTVGSPVIGALVAGQSFSDLQDPVMIVLRLTNQV